MNLNICLKDRGNLREFWRIMGKYRILDVKYVGSKGLNKQNKSELYMYLCKLSSGKFNLQ